MRRLLVKSHSTMNGYIGSTPIMHSFHVQQRTSKTMVKAAGDIDMSQADDHGIRQATQPIDVDFFTVDTKESQLARQKQQTRKEVKVLLSKLTDVDIVQQSTNVCKQIMQMDIFKSCQIVSIYLPMTKEILTYPIIDFLLENKKRVFVPKVLGPNPENMIMHELCSLDDMTMFKVSKWGIPECTLSDLKVSEADTVDLVVCPGIAFSTDGRRLGHGRGYYDNYLIRLNQQRAIPVTTIGLALTQQMTEKIPVGGTDVPMTHVIQPIDR
eukprot:GHVL01024775.1.p1 GENE.GHVL01024775.1~~GHVL01024775.1.p1  ORF type:complete len:268 (+),score=19.95 GHVL01024775.1:44-847(+)